MRARESPDGAREQGLRERARILPADFRAFDRLSQPEAGFRNTYGNSVRRTAWQLRMTFRCLSPRHLSVDCRQPERKGRVRCSAWLDHAIGLTLLIHLCRQRLRKST